MKRLKFGDTASVNDHVKKNGVLAYADMPAEVYHSTSAVSHSMLKMLKQSPAKLRWEMDHPRKQSAAFAIGTAIHAALLEPDIFEATYRVKRDKPVEPERPPHLADVTRRSAEGKAKLDAWELTWLPKYQEDLALWEKERANKTMLSQEDMDTVTRVHARTMDDDFFGQFFSSGEKERSFFAKDEQSGLVLRCRPDNLVETKHGQFIIDLKSTDCAQEFIFNGDITKYGYLTQAAFYLMTVEMATGKRPDGFAIIAVEKSRDCDMQAFYFEDEEIELATKMCRQWLTVLARCIAADSWPGYERRFIKYRAPEWLARSLEVEG